MATAVFETTPRTSLNYYQYKDFRSDFITAPVLIDGATPKTIDIPSTAWKHIGNSILFSGTVTTSTNHSTSPYATVSGANWAINAFAGCVLKMVGIKSYFYIESNTTDTLTLAGINRKETGTGSCEIYQAGSFTVPIGAGGLNGNFTTDQNAVTYHVTANGGTLPTGLNEGDLVWVQHINDDLYGLTLSLDQFSNRYGPAENFIQITNAGSGTIRLIENRLIDYRISGNSILAEDNGMGWKGTTSELKTSVNMTNKLLSISLQSIVNDFQDLIFVATDINGNWKSFKVSSSSVNIATKSYCLIDLENSTNFLYEYGTFDVTQVKKLYLALDNKIWIYGDASQEPIFYLWDKEINIVGGTLVDPITWADIYTLCETTYPAYLFRVQDLGIQYQTRVGINFGGSGAVETHISDNVRSIVFPPEANGTSVYKDYTPFLTLQINGTDSSEFIFKNHQFGRENNYNFTVNPNDSSSKSLTGSVLVNANYVSKATDTYTSVVFLGANNITTNNASFTDCIFDAIVNPISYSTNLIRPTFRNMNNGITINVSGNYNLSDVTFSNNTNDIQVTATSGVVNISLGDKPTPTYTTAGATVNFVLNATLTLTGLKIGSDVVILEAGTNTVLASADQVIGTTFSYTYSIAQPIDIGVIKQGYVTLYQYGYSLGATNASLPIQQLIDRNYK